MGVHDDRMFRIEFGPAAEQTIREMVPTETVLRAIEMLRSIGETAVEMDSGEGPALGKERLRLILTVDSFLFHYTLEVRSPMIRVFSVLPATHGAVPPSTSSAETL